MSASLFSQSWYRVAELKPKLRSHAERARHHYRGETWYVLHDHSSGKLHRFSEAANVLVSKMDGSKTLDDIWTEACAELGDDMPGQDETIQLLSQLYRSNALQTDVMPDLEEIYRRQQQEQRTRWLQYLKSPLAIRIPVWNPQSFLRRTQGLAPLIFNRWFAMLWLFIVIAALIQVAMHWPALSANFTDQAFSVGNWLALAVIYPFVKLFHEFAHAYAVKRWGGDVHEMGFMFLVLVPVPYVDASASALFRNKYHRMMVSASGMIAELLLAAIATLIWVQAEPGLFRALLFNVMLLGGVSTLFFNGNPLLRFDAYYVLADWLELPNLGKRANQYLGYIVKKYMLRQRETSPSGSHRESLWLFFYSIAAFFYRLFVMMGIAFYVASELFFIGVMLAFWSLYQSLLAPLINIIKSIWPESLMRNYRSRLVLTTSGFLLAGYLLLFVLALPSFTVAQGVYWAPDESQLHAGADCFVNDVLVTQGQWVEQGDAILQCDSIVLRSQSRVIKLRLDEMQMQRRAVLGEDVVEASVLSDEIGRLKVEQALIKQRLDALLISSPVAGYVQLANLADLKSRYLQRGIYLGYISQRNLNTVRVVVSQQSIAKVRGDTVSIEVRSASGFSDISQSLKLREVPAANKTILSSALTLEGGGTIAVDPASADQAQALDNWFQFELLLPAEANGFVGERVYARFSHSAEPLGIRMWRAIRLLFLETLAI